MATGSGPDGLSYVLSNTIVFPLTITAATNDQFEYNEVEYIIPAGTYANPAALAAAINAAKNDEDFTASPAFNTLVVVYGAQGAHKLYFVSKKARKDDTTAFGTGLENDALASIGLSDTWTIDRTQAGGDSNKNSNQGTLYASSVYYDGTAYVTNQNL